MGAACTGCGHKNSYESIYRDFWEKIKIRTIPQADWSMILKSNTSAKKINDKKWEGIMIKNLVLTENPEMSSTMFRKAMTISEEKGGQYLLLISILFLCQKNSMQTKKEFEDMAKILFGMKNEFKVENNFLHMKKQKLIEIVTFYVSLISLYAVDVLSSLAPNKKDYEDILSKVFTEDVVITFIEEEIIKESNNEEWMNLDHFFETKYHLLNDDAKVRERLTFWSDNSIKIVTI